MARGGEWQATDFFREPAPRADGTTAVEVEPEAAAVVLFGWRERGVIGFGEGVDYPPLPADPNPAPPPGTGR